MKIKLLITFLLISITFYGCQEETEETRPAFEEVDDIVGITTETSLKNTLSFLQGNEINARSASTEMDFGTLDLQQIVKRIIREDQPNPNYIIRLLPPTEVNNTVEYLMMNGVEGGYRAYILQYESLDGSFPNLETFSGYKRILDFDRQSLSENLFENGEDVTSTVTGGRAAWVCYCDYSRPWVHFPTEQGTTASQAEALDCNCYPNEDRPIAGPGSGGSPPGGFLPDNGDDYADGERGGGNGGSSTGSDVLPDQPQEGDDIAIILVPPCEEGYVRTEEGLCMDAAELWEEEQIDDSELDPCIKNILNDIKNLHQGVGQIIQQFSGDTPGLNWKLQNGILLDDVNASTSQGYDVSTGTVTTSFDSRKFSDATDLSIAKTILHEAIHAHMIALVRSDKLTFAETYSGLFLEVLKNKFGVPNPNARDHAVFAQSLINDISSAIREYGELKGYELSDQFYNDLAWGGLTHWVNKDGIRELAPWFTLNFPEKNDRDRILDTLQIEQYGVDNNGHAKNQKGNETGC